MKAQRDRMYELVLTISATCGGLQINTAHAPLKGCSGAYALAWARCQAAQEFSHYKWLDYEDELEMDQRVLHYMREFFRENSPRPYNNRGVTLDEHIRAQGRLMTAKASKRRQRRNSQA